MITIDGSKGEGGGQILRTSVALSAITGTPVRLTNIRANRSKDGLMRQHLTAVRAAAEVCGGQLTGAELRATEVEFVPGEVTGGEYDFKVGTAGSAALVLQTVLPILLSAGVRAEIAVEGGTHAKSAPPYHFLHHAYGRAVRSIGADFLVELERYGFFPAGGGRIVARLEANAELRPFELVAERPFDTLEGLAIVGELSQSIGEREVNVLREAFDDLDLDQHYETLCVSSRCPGNVLHVRLAGGATDVFTEFGERGRPAEDVAEALVRRASEFLETGAPVGEHLADQLLVLLSVGAGGRFRTVPLSLHSETMLEVIPEFLDVEFVVEEVDGLVEVEVRS